MIYEYNLPMNFEKIVTGIGLLIEGIGDDVSREGLRDTPRRVATMWQNFFETKGNSDEELLKQTFVAENYGGFVIVKNIHFSSFCEHHLLPFFGSVSIAYIPRNGTVVGLSKLVRIIDKYAKRLQLQERLTQQILEAIGENTANDGVLVIISGQHMCMSVRGVMQPGSKTITRAVSGKFSSEKLLAMEAQQLIFETNGEKL
ncbi:MAG: GTP cyclohydrolase I FolE [Puniceicoccales bacterium]|jgi:GTP cyclohydrolase I|nr:GTP cyclohydrolase I FolE [Puniceicoccales bacterium]